MLSFVLSFFFFLSFLLFVFVCCSFLFFVCLFVLIFTLGYRVFISYLKLRWMLSLVLCFSCSFFFFLSFFLSSFCASFSFFPFLLSFFLLCYEWGHFCEFSQSKFSWIEEVSLQSLFCFLDNCTSPNTAELWPGCQEVPSPTGGKWEPQEPGTGQPQCSSSAIECGWLLQGYIHTL